MCTVLINKQINYICIFGLGIENTLFISSPFYIYIYDNYLYIFFRGIVCFFSALRAGKQLRP